MKKRHEIGAGERAAGESSLYASVEDETNKEKSGGEYTHGEASLIRRADNKAGAGPDVGHVMKRDTERTKTKRRAKRAEPTNAGMYSMPKY